MGSTAQIALIAIRASARRDTTSYHALLIGTRKEDVAGELQEVWKFVCYPLDDLLRMLHGVQTSSSGGVVGDFDPFDDEARRPNNGFWTNPNQVDELRGGRLIPDEQTLISVWKERLPWPPKGTVCLPFRDVVQVAFYRGDNSPFNSPTEGEKSLHGPYARLETCRAINPKEESSEPRLPEVSPPEGKIFQVGSFIEVAADPSRPGTLHGFRALLDIKLALNGHFFGDAEEGKAGDAFDTRGRIVLSCRKQQRRSLWKYAPGRVPGENACVFDKIWMGWTTGSVYFGHPYCGEVIGSRKSLLELANPEQPKKCAYPDPESGPSTVYSCTRVSRIPLLDVAQIDFGSVLSVRREFGFRITSYDDHVNYTYPRLVLRFELRASDFGRSFLGNRPVLSLLPPGLSPTGLDPDYVWFAQEQRQGDVNGSFCPDDPVRWLLTARVDAGAIKGMISPSVVKSFSDLVSIVHRGMRWVTDGRPLSFLPVIKPSILQGANAPWHFVGILEERSAHERAAPYEYLPPTDPTAGRIFRFSSFEPRLIEDMWAGAKNDHRGDGRIPGFDHVAYFKGKQPRVVTEKKDALECVFQLTAPRAIDGRANPSVVYPGWQPAVSLIDDPFGIPLGTRFALTVREPSRARLDGTGPETAPTPKQHAVSLGALRLIWGRRFDEDQIKNPEGFVLLRALESDPKQKDILAGGVDVLLKYPILDIEAADQDELDSDIQISARVRRQHELDFKLPNSGSPLLFPLAGGTLKAEGANAKNEDPPSSITLVVEETVTRHRNHTLALSLRKVSERPAEKESEAAISPTDALETKLETEKETSQVKEVLVIDPQPFRIAKVSYVPFTGTDESAEVAVWNASGEGGLSWRIRDEGETIHLVLPPQTIGEAMEKNRATIPGLPHDVEPDRPAAARFGSRTELLLDPTFAETRYREPGWNLRRILGQAMQRSPGARLQELRLELLYGLLTRIKSKDVWYAEIAGAIGEAALPVTDVSDKPYLKRHAALINAVLAAQQRRIAVDKLWKDRPDQELLLEDGVSFRLRRREIDLNSVLGPVTKLRWPVPGQMPEETGGLIDRAVLSNTFEASDTDETSFPGGLAWAFESANILMSVYGKPGSDGGSVRGIHLSAHGGYGSQRALFDERKTIVETETTQGRLQRYRLERIGRIGCLWNRAKHVIVYERSVVPPAQFYNTDPIGLRQDEHAGQPVVRKVEEYVELLQPVRHYPEDKHSTELCAFVRGVEFTSRKIRVDSSWGSDVRREGWQVPLWSKAFLNRQPRPEDPDDPVNLYPKPQVRFIMVSESGAEVPVEVDEPEKMHFYTSVVSGEGEDTDSWKEVRDVDFCDCPPPQVGAMPPQTADLHDGMLPGAPEHVPGYERFTIGLVPAKDAIAITAGRVDGGPSAVLRNVTISRSKPVTSGDARDQSNGATLGNVLALKGANVSNEIDRTVGRIVAHLEKLDRNTTDIKNETLALLEEGLRQMREGLDGLANSIRNMDDFPKGVSAPLGAECAGLEKAVLAQVDGQLQRLSIVAQEMLKTTANEAINRILGAATSADKEVGYLRGAQANAVQLLERAKEEAASSMPKEQADKLKLVLKAGLHQVRKRLESFKSAPQRLRSICQALPGMPNAIKNEINAARAQVSVDLKALISHVSGGIEAEGENLEKTFSEVIDVLGNFDSVLSKIGDTNPLTEEARKAAKQIGEAMERARSKVLDESMDRLGKTNPSPTARRILASMDRQLAKALEYVRQAELETEKKVGEVRAGLADAVQKMKTVKEAVAGRLGAASGGALDTLIAELEKFLDTGTTYAKGIVDSAGDPASIAGPLAQVEEAIGEKLDSVSKAIEAAAIDLDQEIDRISTSVSQSLFEAGDRLIGSIKRPIKDFESINVAKMSNVISVISRDLTDKAKKAAESVKRSLEETRIELDSKALQLVDSLRDTCKELEGFIGEVAKNAESVGASICDALDLNGFATELEKLTEAADKAASAANATIENVKQAVAKAAADISRRMDNRGRQLLGAVQETVRDITGSDLNEIERRAEGVYQRGNNAIRAIRALGDPPKTDRLSFNRPEVAYVFGEAKKLGVDMTPALALVNRVSDKIAAAEQAGKAVGELLDSFGLRMPTSRVIDQFDPAKLEGLSAAGLIPDMAAIDFDGLLQRVGFPDLDDSNAIKISHGFDRGTLTAWMRAEIDVPFGESVPLMESGPVQIMIDDARFTASARISGGREGTEKTMDGNIHGDWRVVCGGQTILTFRKTGLYFDQTGKIDFRIQPDQVEFAEALKFLTQLAKASGRKGQIAVEPLMRGGVPSGMAAALDMTLPNIQTGVFGISDLSLHILFGIAAVPKFELISELSVGSRLAPFTLNVWILNGGGYLLQRLSFLPTANPPSLTYVFEAGIVAGVGVGFSFGVVSGGVWLQVGCSVAMTWTTTAGGGTTAIRVFILARGNVDVAGLITASIALLMEVTYDGSNMIGAGMLTIRVKISMFYTLRVNQRVEYVFAGSGSKEVDHSDSYC